MPSKKVVKYANLTGAFSAGLCIVHCVAFPVFFASSLSSGKLAEWEGLHFIFIFIALLAIYFSTRKIVNKLLRIQMWSWGIIFSLTLLLHEVNSNMIYISVLASIILLLLHIANHLKHKSVV